MMIIITRLYKLVKWCKSLPLFKNILIDDQVIITLLIKITSKIEKNNRLAMTMNITRII